MKVDLYKTSLLRIFKAGGRDSVARTGKDETTWINCVVFGARSAPVLDYFKKGSKVTVTGKGQLRIYQKQDGSQGSSLELNVNDFTLPERQQEVKKAVTDLF